MLQQDGPRKFFMFLVSKLGIEFVHARHIIVTSIATSGAADCVLEKSQQWCNLTCRNHLDWLE